jgi:hypothetical protein
MRKELMLFYILFSTLLFSCKDIIVTEPDTNLNLQDFESAWKRVNDIYPYLEFKNINWDSVYNVYKPRAESAHGDDIYIVLGDLLAELKDGHVFYKTNGGAEVYPYYPKRHFKDRHAYSPFVVRKYFNKELIITEYGSMEYEIIPGNIGYLFISDFHEDNFPVEFYTALEYLRNTKGLIIDIRQKRGGNYQNIEAVVQRFITKPLERNEAYRDGVKLDFQPFVPQGSFQYIKPVVVLINGSTFSAGEFTTEILKQLPHVTAVGDTTGGGSAGGGDESIFSLPSGKSISVDFIDFRRYDGLPWEWLGVPPDIRIVQTEKDIIAGRDKQLEYAINFLN